MKRGREGNYGGAGVSSDIKEHTAYLALYLEDEGVAVETFHVALLKTDYHPALYTLKEHMRDIRRGGTPLSDAKRTGAKKKLSMEQEDIVCGAVLAQLGAVGLKFVQEWIGANFDINVSTMLCSTMLKQQNLSFQLFGSQNWPKGTTQDTYVLGYFEFVKRLHDHGVFLRDAAKIICIDACTNSVRLDRHRGLAVKGG